MLSKIRDFLNTGFGLQRPSSVSFFSIRVCILMDGDTGKQLNVKHSHRCYSRTSKRENNKKLRGGSMYQHYYYF